MTTYSQAGVNIDAANTFVNRLKKLCPNIGGFGGLFPFGEHYLVASTDGVGTKLKLGFQANIHTTVGIDLVAMSVNDIITLGATPLFFLDYLATSKLDPNQAEKVVQGILEGCQKAGCQLLGGETAEMPGFYAEGEYDLAGFAVGVVKKDQLIDGSTLSAGDSLVGFASSGFHSNGFSLVRKLMKPTDDINQLLTPTRIYVDDLKAILSDVKGASHITGGGLTENVPRLLKKGLKSEIYKNSWPVPEIFLEFQKRGGISDQEMARTFNMGIGMVVAMDPKKGKDFCASREDAWVIGEIH